MNDYTVLNITETYKLLKKGIIEISLKYIVTFYYILLVFFKLILKYKFIEIGIK